MLLTAWGNHYGIGGGYARSHHDLPGEHLRLLPQSPRGRRRACQVLITVVHEVAHHFGIDDPRLRELGWAYLASLRCLWRSRRILLHEHEELVRDLRPHWRYMAEPTAALLGAAILGLLRGARRLVGDPRRHPQLRVDRLTHRRLPRLVRHPLRASGSAPTSSIPATGMIYRVGVLSKKGIEIPLERAIRN